MLFGAHSMRSPSVGNEATWIQRELEFSDPAGAPPQRGRPAIFET